MTQEEKEKIFWKRIEELEREHVEFFKRRYPPNNKLKEYIALGAIKSWIPEREIKISDLITGELRDQIWQAVREFL
jgi:hypothetical protein